MCARCDACGRIGQPTGKTAWRTPHGRSGLEVPPHHARAQSPPSHTSSHPSRHAAANSCRDRCCTAPALCSLQLGWIAVHARRRGMRWVDFSSHPISALSDRRHQWPWSPFRGPTPKSPKATRPKASWAPGHWSLPVLVIPVMGVGIHCRVVFPFHC